MNNKIANLTTKFRSLFFYISTRIKYLMTQSKPTQNRFFLWILSKMKQKKIYVMFFLLTLISALIFRPLEATFTCPTKNALDLVPKCFDAVRLAAYGDERFLTELCCQAVKAILPDCLLIVDPNKAVNTEIFKDICRKKFPRP